MAITVTATEAGAASANGIALKVLVVTGGTAAGGASNSASGLSTAAQVSLTPNSSNSLLTFAVVNGNNSTTFTAATNNTMDMNVSDGTHLTAYGGGHWTSTVTSGVAATVGASAPTGVPQTIGAYEIQPSGSVAIDGSSPAVVSTTAALTITTASFTPPGGSVLVALVSFNTATSGAYTITVSDSSSLTWTQRVIGDGPAGGHEGTAVIFTATTAATGVSPLPLVAGQAVKRAAYY
jgi:hypothetical protein